MRRAGTCETGKFRYRSELDAKIMMSNLAFKETQGDARREEKRAYKCPKCYGWHLTSQSQRRSA
jgi:hypothetical protein